MAEVDPRRELLEQATSIVTGARAAVYGGPEDNFRRIANLWNAYIADTRHVDVDLQPHDVAALMILMKVARLEESPGHFDSWLDVAGYAACGWATRAAEGTS